MVNLSVKDLIKEFPGGVRAVDGVNFTVSAGSLFTLLGPSGCGKTTTLRLVAGLESPTSGHILFNNEDYTTFPPHRRNIGMVFQSYALFPHMTVFENVAYGLRVRNASNEDIRRRVGDALDLVGLEHTADRRPSQLSGGQQQRIALARALVYDPSILLLDEPLSNLDAKLRVQMRSEIRRIQKAAGATTVYVTHDQEEALSISDVVAVLHSGSISQMGLPHEIYEKPASAIVADFIGKANFIDCEVVSRNQHSGERCLVSITPECVIEVGRCAGEKSAFADGRPALLFFRPEKASIAKTAVSRQSIPCTVTQILYLGESVRYMVELVTGENVSVALNRRVESITEGDSAFVITEPADCTIYPYEQKAMIEGGN
ncbi:MAG: ABC transporter ATP-binding protein [Firmicutes bacterium]|jgi:spermidine/putrescine ABC transporter ATP-binding subunit|nr:ABC transporter ATP-binding protein [Bacillota bacterium]